MSKNSGRKLNAIACAVVERKLAAIHIEQLRASIASVQTAGAGQRDVRATLRDLKVAAAQLKTFQSKAEGALDDDSFRTLPPHLQRRILARFERLTTRLATLERMRASRSARRHRTGRHADAAFRCLHDYEASRAAPEASAFWCQLALVVCLLSCLAPLMRHSRSGRQ